MVTSDKYRGEGPWQTQCSLHPLLNMTLAKKNKKIFKGKLAQQQKADLGPLIDM
jgi:hypothetical protein